MSIRDAVKVRDLEAAVLEIHRRLAAIDEILDLISGVTSIEEGKKEREITKKHTKQLLKEVNKK